MRNEYLHYSCSLTVSLIAALYEFFFAKVSFIPYFLNKKKNHYQPKKWQLWIIFFLKYLIPFTKFMTVILFLLSIFSADTYIFSVLNYFEFI